MSAHVAVVGSANADLVTQVQRRPGPGETVAGSDLAVHPGGKGANQAAAAGWAGASVRFVGCVGDDEHGGVLRGALTDAGVDVTHLATVDRPTGAALIQVTPDGENSIVISPGANSEVLPAFADGHRAAWADADVVVLNLEIPDETVTHVASGGARLVLNRAPAGPLEPDLLARCDPLVVNEHEARAVLDLPDDTAYDEVVARLLDAGARSVVLTLGADGALVATSEGTEEVPAHRVEKVVDTTGAGDAFVGALAAELATGSTLVDAARFATAMSALVVQGAGAQSSYPSREETLVELSRAPA